MLCQVHIGYTLSTQEQGEVLQERTEEHIRYTLCYVRYTFGTHSVHRGKGKCFKR
jgi:hypothetical protein